MPAEIPIDLPELHRKILIAGLHEWGGPARMTNDIADVIGFESVADFDTQRARLVDALRAGAPLTADDWRRVLLATEIVFVSDVVGSGVEWPTTTGFEDAETLEALRAMQRTILDALADQA